MFVFCFFPKKKWKLGLSFLKEVSKGTGDRDRHWCKPYTEVLLVFFNKDLTSFKHAGHICHQSDSELTGASWTLLGSGCPHLEEVNWPSELSQRP